MSTRIPVRNQQNAQHSTGPKTEAGKAKSAQNARTHGLSSASLFLPDDRLEEFKTLFTALYDEVRPIGELQMQFFDQLTHAAWNTNIARELLTLALHQLDDKKIANANRYIAQYEKSFARALKELKSLQTDLALRAASENEPIADLPLTCEIKLIGNEATKLARHQPSAERATHRVSTLARIGAAFHPPLPIEELPQAA